MKNNNKTAALLVIGNELLSGRTQDRNLNYIAIKLAEIGVNFNEARFVKDLHSEISESLNELRAKYDYVFTTGGIGPTHDDITTESVAKAFDVNVIEHPKAREALENYYKNRESELNEARLRMALVPEGAELIDNPLTSAPGYKIDNVFVLAGIPSIMKVMLDSAIAYLEVGKKIISKSVSCDLIEGDVAGSLDSIQANFPDIELGSYPFINEGKYAVSVVVRGFDASIVESAYLNVINDINKLGGNIIEK